MSWSFKPGDRVVCVQTAPRWVRKKFWRFKWYAPRPGFAEVGKIYTVLDLYMSQLYKPEKLFLKLVEHGHGHAFDPILFRPVRTTSIESLRVHLNTIPANRSVDA